eukprot:CAMPEP_0113579978 /NCGR_PEP_ID=MMETSP0015_2-20120614/30390_1 /TAXON_ID=2838 /ORGANISM="Odontella" /LENGTH=95 /DNA_ID=CAMNT_0000484061 /DNA_START=1084 /DNA_END=1371 /DNA_ORIENTATION=- /assembly_acc=CAM_ASM_000160
MPNPSEICPPVQEGLVPYNEEQAKCSNDGHLVEKSPDDERPWGRSEIPEKTIGATMLQPPLVIEDAPTAKSGLFRRGEEKLVVVVASFIIVVFFA